MAALFHLARSLFEPAVTPPRAIAIGSITDTRAYGDELGTFFRLSRVSY
jgi:hypothetical protein